MFGFDNSCWCQTDLLPNSRLLPQKSDYTTLATTLQLLSEAACIVNFKSVAVLSVLSEEHCLWRPRVVNLKLDIFPRWF